MSISDQEHINFCVISIEEKLRWESSDQWKQRDFENLSSLIEEETKILLSVSTLKRLWRGNFNRLPQKNTLNALAKFIEYNDWAEFKYKTDLHQTDVPDIDQGLESLSMKAGYIQRMLYVIGFLILSVLLVYLFFYKESNKGLEIDNIQFSSQTSINSGVPNTVIFNYDISAIDFDSAWIQQSWNDEIIEHINKEDHYQSCLYYYPGYHHAKLVIDDKIVKETAVHITSDGWLSVARTDRKVWAPTYIRNKSVISKNQMQVTPEILARNGIDSKSKSFVLHHYNVTDFGNLHSSNFTLETSLKHNIDEGGGSCQFCYITIICENGRHFIPLCGSGCISEIDLKFAENYVSGRNNDLSAFGTDLADWQNLKCKVVDKQVKIYLNEKKIYSLSFERDNGLIKGIVYSFYGCGAVDYLNLYNKTNDIVFKENFEKELDLSDKP